MDFVHTLYSSPLFLLFVTYFTMTLAIPMETLKTLNNHETYLNVLRLSERIQCAIQRLKQHRIEQEIDDLLLQSSPTETMMTYYDNNNRSSMMMMTNAKCMYLYAHAILIILVHSLNNNRTYVHVDKSLPKLITTSKHSSSASTVTTIAQYDHKKEKTNSNTTTVVYQSKSGKSSRHGGFDSAVDLYITARQEEEEQGEKALLQQKPPTPPPLTRSTYLRTKPLPSIHYNKSRLLPTIHHTKKVCTRILLDAACIKQCLTPPFFLSCRNTMGSKTC